ncbi:MAG: hypothetical protein EA352_10345, partial [Gemmatimonadales bacterium]
DDIVERLREVLSREGVEATGEALHIIARKADGGMRDALSLTDQVLALAGQRVEPADVRRVLGIVEDDLYLELFEHLAHRRQDRLLELVERIRDQGGDVVEFYHGLLEALRALLRLRTGGTPRRVAPERLEDWKARAEPFEPADLVRMLGMAAELETTGSLRRTGQPDVLLELLLLRMVYLDRTVDVEGLLRVLGGDSLPDTSPGRGDDGALPPSADPSPPKVPRPEPQSSEAPPSGAPFRPDPTRGRTGEVSRRPGSETSSGDGDEEGAVRDEDPAPAPRSHPSAAESRPPSGGSLPPVAAWRDLLRSGDGLPPGFGPFLHGAMVSETGDGGLELVLPPGPAEERLRTAEVRAVLDRALARRAGRPVPLMIRTVAVQREAESASERITREEVRRGLLEDLLEEEPTLRPAVEALDLEISD